MMRKQAGMSLIELMVAMGLGIFLITGVINVFLANKESTQVETSLARLQENGRIALDLIAADIRQAYNVGCSGGAGLFVNMIDGSSQMDAFQGWELSSAGIWSPALPAALNPINATARRGSDVINVRHARRLILPITSAVTSTSAGVAITSDPSECIFQGEAIMLSGCMSVHLFEVTNTPACDGTATTLDFGAASNTLTSVNFDYTVDDTLMQAFDKVWYVRDTGRTRTALNIPVFALYRRVNGTEEEMIEGVEYMQLQYGQLLNTGNVRYISADDGNLDLLNDDVVSVRVGLLLQSFEPVLESGDTRAYQVLDQSIDSAGTTFTHNGDLTLRRVFRTTVMLRNRPTDL